MCDAPLLAPQRSDAYAMRPLQSRCDRAVHIAAVPNTYAKDMDNHKLSSLQFDTRSGLWYMASDP